MTQIRAVERSPVRTIDLHATLRNLLAGPGATGQSDTMMQIGGATHRKCWQYSSRQLLNKLHQYCNPACSTCRPRYHPSAQRATGPLLTFSFNNLSEILGDHGAWR